jgi:hypothetical protein
MSGFCAVLSQYKAPALRTPSVDTEPNTLKLETPDDNHFAIKFDNPYSRLLSTELLYPQKLFRL